MPLEIKELHIKTTITKGSSTSATTGNGGINKEKEKAQWMQECIDKILEILQEKMER